MLTFYDMQQDVLQWVDESADTDVTRTLVKAALNRSHRQVLSERTFPFMLWPNEESFSTVSGTRVYALKHGVSKILTLYDQTLGCPTPMISRREWETVGVDRAQAQGVPVGVIYGDVWPVSAQPESAAVSIVSSSASDTAVTVVLEGLDDSGDAAAETVTASGTTPVASTTLWSHLWSVSKTGTWVGTLTVTTGGTTILSLGATAYGKQYPTLEFIETPNSARTHLYTAQRIPKLLTNDYDIPDTPYPYSAIHVYDALLDLTAYNTELGAKEQRLWQSRREEIHRALLSSVDETIAGSYPRFVRNMNARATTRFGQATG